MRVVLGFLLLASLAHAETGQDAWLRYRTQSAKLPHTVVKLGEEAEIILSLRKRSRLR